MFYWFCLILNVFAQVTAEDRKSAASNIGGKAGQMGVAFGKKVPQYNPIWDEKARVVVYVSGYSLSPYFTNLYTSNTSLQMSEGCLGAYNMHDAAFACLDCVSSDKLGPVLVAEHGSLWMR